MPSSGRLPSLPPISVMDSILRKAESAGKAPVRRNLTEPGLAQQRLGRPAWGPVAVVVPSSPQTTPLFIPVTPSASGHPRGGLVGPGASAPGKGQCQQLKKGEGGGRFRMLHEGNPSKSILASFLLFRPLQGSGGLECLAVWWTRVQAP